MFSTNYIVKAFGIYNRFDGKDKKKYCLSIDAATVVLTTEVLYIPL